jgi:hypothetical protein
MSDLTDQELEQVMADVEAGDESESDKRQRGAISFPYYDLSDAEKVAGAAWEIAGAGPAPLDAVMAKLGHTTVQSGGFRGKTSAARLFGLTRTSGMNLTLTELGRQIVQGSTRDQARVDAFLRVPLYRAMYDKYRGGTLPGEAGIEAEMVALGVTPKQRDRARQGFQRSAEHAGFFRAGRDKLIAPTFGTTPADQTEPEADEPPAQEQVPVSVSTEPLIRGLFEKLPPPGPWAESERQRWLDAASMIFGLVYQEEPKAPKALPSAPEQPSEQSQNGAGESEPQT